MSSAGTESEDAGGLASEALAGSTAVASIRTVQRWLPQSAIYRLATGTAGTVGPDSGTEPGRLQKFLRGSRTVGAFGTVENWARGSFLYRWLTTEPEPEVIVIDLRESLFVGPVIRALDWAVEWVAPRWRVSGSRRVSEAIAAQLEARPVRSVGLVLTTAVIARFLVQTVTGSVSTATVLTTVFLLGIGVLAMRSDRSLADLQESRFYRLLVALLEPPPPPEEEGSGTEEDNNDPSDRGN